MNASQKRVLSKMKQLKTPAGLAELHKGTKGHKSKTYNALLRLQEAGLVEKQGAGRSTVYVLKEASGRKSRAVKVTIKPTRWVILVDGEALIVEAAHVEIYRERA